MKAVVPIGMALAKKSVFEEIEEVGEQSRLPPKILLTAKEAAYLLGFTESAFHQAEWRKEIPEVKIGQKTRYLLEDLIAFAKRHRVEEGD